MLQLGQIVMTRGIADKVAEDKLFAKEVMYCIKRHMNGDWGDICDEDKQLNNEALYNSDRILSAYKICDTEIWIITEWDRSYTTVLFPEEY